MSATDSTVSRFESLPFQPLGAFEPPSLPRDETLKRHWKRYKHLLKRDDDKPFIADDRLQRSTLEVLDDQHIAPVCQPLMDELELSLGDWCREDVPSRWLQLIVMPPGDENELLTRWAREQGHTLLSPPAKEALLSGEDISFALEGDGVLVIAHLEDWFFRHRHGLASIRHLLERLSGLTRPCVIGCDSWAWAFLCKAAGAHLFLPEPLTFQPFDELRLHRWFSDIAAQEALAGYRFRLTRDGRDILATDDEGQPVSDYFGRLASYSRGIPWIAWHLWHRSLRSRAEAEADAEESEGGNDSKETTTEAGQESKAGQEDKKGEAREDTESHPDNCQPDVTSLTADEQTLWIIALEEFSLPGSGDSDALLILQALLIHASLSRSELARVLPAPPSGMLQSLEGAGFIEQRQSRYRVSPAAYPAIRSGLSTAGFPTGGL